jgi:PleD family two-component response regulator
LASLNALEDCKELGKMVTDCYSNLVADDESEYLALLTGILAILAAEGYHVRSAEASQLALVSVAACQPQLILLDAGGSKRAMRREIFHCCS